MLVKHLTYLGKSGHLPWYFKSLTLVSLFTYAGKFAVSSCELDRMSSHSPTS